ncbi:hypothetical protein IIA95_02950, partial [Patescibacteria group bacterium]|nr:hypothetical protein [Patescibacteria group bacterium]
MKHRCEIFLEKLFKSAPFFMWALGIFFFAIMFSVFGFISLKAEAAPGVPNVISYQGRLTDSNDSLLGGVGTKFFFKFSIWDASDIATGTRLWPSSPPGTASSTVKEGVFTVDIGDPADTPDLLTFNFKDSDTVYLQVEVSSTEAGTFETLDPRQRITSSGYAINASTVLGIGQSAIGTTTPVSDATLTVEATSTSVIPLVVRGFLGQVADLFRIITSAGAQLFTFTSGGFFGIGTSTPSEALSVEGSVFISGNLIATGTTRFNSNTYTWPTSIVDGNFLQTDSSGNLTWAVAGGGGGGAGNWVFVDSQGGYIRLATTTNRAGIGTTTPYAKLSIDSGAVATTTLALRPFTSQTANIIDIYDTSATPVLTSVFTSANFLGIGTTSPTEQLSVANLLYVGGSGTSTFENNLEALGDFAANQIFLGGATSTAANGWDITSGCFAINGACVGGAASEWTDGGNFLNPNEVNDSILIGSSDFAGINALFALRATSTTGTI